MKLPSTLIALLIVSPLHAQESGTADPYINQSDPKKAAPAKTVEIFNLSSCYETFSLPMADAAEMQRRQLSDSELYEALIAAVKKDAARQEGFTVIRSRGGEISSSESVSEYIYPTEFEPAELPNTVGVAITPPPVKDVKPAAPDAAALREAPPLSSFEGVRTPATPTAFETRNTGVTVELEASVDTTGRWASVRIANQHVTHVGTFSWGQELSTCELPEFEAQRLSTACTVEMNQPYLLGTLNRPPVSKVDPDSANRVWFAFLTIHKAKP